MVRADFLLLRKRNIRANEVAQQKVAASRATAINTEQSRDRPLPDTDCLCGG